MREDFLEPFPPPVGPEVFRWTEQAIVWKSDAPIAAHQLHSVGAAQLSQDLPCWFPRRKAFHHERPQVPGKSFLPQRRGDAADVVGLFNHIHLTTIAGKIGRRRQASHSGPNNDCSRHGPPPCPFPRWLFCARIETAISDGSNGRGRRKPLHSVQPPLLPFNVRFRRLSKNRPPMV